VPADHLASDGVRRWTIRTEDGTDLAGVVLEPRLPRATGREVVPGVGHAESGATAPLVERIGRWASATIQP
jgi:hypothetical protein